MWSVRNMQAMNLRLQAFVFAFLLNVGLGGSASAAPTSIAQATPQPSATPEIVRIDIDPAHKVQTFRPLQALGSTVDKEPAGMIPALYSRENIRQMLDTGLGWLSYRLFTELSVQDWHWNPAGTFSAGDRGYWTSSASTSRSAITDSFGYRLPHRGFTPDQGNNEDYSRLDDGNVRTYWKSNPYLSRAFTGESDELHPQWIVVDLGAPKPVDAVRIAWSNPYAVVYHVDYWVGDDPINDPGSGIWQTFEYGRVARGHGGQALLRLSGSPVAVQYLRVLMTGSSNTCDSHGPADRRNCVGYAVNEIYVGMLDQHGAFHDLINHRPCGGEKPGPQSCGLRQTATYASSVDPWHSIENRVRNQEQPGLDLIARSGLARGIGAMYPVPMLYSTPQNAVNEITYLLKRSYPIAYIELGEEPDGQYTTPEDDAALYIQWARAIHAVFPKLKLGGPVFSGVNSELQTWPDAQGNISWLNRFITYLQRHNAQGELAFMSFEHYPFGGCDQGALLQKDLLQEPSIVKGIVNTWHSDGLPTNVPLYISEANFSAVNLTQVPMQIEGALWLADYMASSLANGVKGVVYYQYEPVPLGQNPACPNDWGNLTIFVADNSAHIRAHDAQFAAAKMLTQQWILPGNKPHDLYGATTNVLEDGLPLITAYTVKRPDDKWSVLLVNKDFRAHTILPEFVGQQGNDVKSFRGSVEVVSFGAAQYQWQSRGANSMPSPNGPPAASIVNLSAAGQTSAANLTALTIPARSITVVRGRIAP